MKTKLINIIYTILVISVFSERFYSYAEVQKEWNPPNDYPKIQSRPEACKEFGGKIITFYDQSALVEDCKQRPIEDTEVLNELIKFSHIPVREVPARIYRMFPMGRDFKRTDLPEVKKAIRGKISAKDCKELNHKFISVDGMKYFYVADCKRYALASLSEPNQPSSSFSGFITVSPETLEKIPLSPKPYSEPGPSEDEILFSIDGQPQWSVLARSKNPAAIKEDTPAELSKMQKQFAKKGGSPNRCSKWDKKIVSFYSEIYFVENCSLRLIEGEYSIDIQQLVEKHGGVSDLDTADYHGFAKGKVISHKELIAKIK